MSGLGVGIYVLVQDPSNWLLWVISALALGGFLLLSWRRGEKGLIDVRILRDHLFVCVSSILFLFSAALMAAFVVFGVFLRQEHTVLDAAIVLFPLPATAVVVSWSITYLVKGRQTQRILLLLALTGLLFMTAGLSGFAWFPSFHPDSLWILSLDLLVGAGMGIGMSVLNALALLRIPPERLGEASGLLGLMQQLGYAIGTALLIWLLEKQGGVAELRSFRLVWWEAAACVFSAVLILGWVWKGNITREKASLHE
jgi:MFS family permease